MGTCSIRRGWLGTGGDRVTCPSPLAGTQWGQASFPACSAIHGAHTAPSSFPAAQEPPPAPRELPGSGDNSSCGWILHAGPLLEAVGDCRSNQQPFPWASLVHSEHHKLHAFICFLVPAHPGEKLHPPTCPSMGEATKTCPCTPVGPSSRAGSSTCEVPRIWGDLAVQKSEVQPLFPTPCSPGAAGAAPGTQGEHQPGRAHGERCKRCLGHFQARRASGCPSPGSPAPGAGWQALGERKVHVEGGATEQSQQRREVVSVSNPDS